MLLILHSNGGPLFALGPPFPLPYSMTGIFRCYVTVWTGIALPVGENEINGAAVVMDRLVSWFGG